MQEIVLNDLTPQEIFKLLREYSGLTQEKFSKTINYSKRGVENLESGARKLSIETMLQIAKAHNLEVIIREKDS